MENIQYWSFQIDESNNIFDLFVSKLTSRPSYFAVDINIIINYLNLKSLSDKSK